MRTIVLDTNCLLAVLPSVSPYHNVWNEILNGNICLCLSTDIISEYDEILTLKTTPQVADAVITAILSLKNTKRVNPPFSYHLIESDYDDNKFVDCAICGNAELIVTNDSHFGILKRIPFPKVITMTIQDFSRIIAN